MRDPGDGFIILTYFYDDRKGAIEMFGNKNKDNRRATGYISPGGDPFESVGGDIHAMGYLEPVMSTPVMSHNCDKCGHNNRQSGAKGTSCTNTLSEVKCKGCEKTFWTAKILGSQDPPLCERKHKMAASSRECEPTGKTAKCKGRYTEVQTAGGQGPLKNKV